MFYRFDSVKRKIERKYCDIEKALIEEFVNVMSNEDLKRMREIAVVLSQFKGYSQCVDAYIDQSQIVSYLRMMTYRRMLYFIFAVFLNEENVQF